MKAITAWGGRLYYGAQGCHIYALSGCGRDAYTVFEADRDLVAALMDLPPGRSAPGNASNSVRAEHALGAAGL